jgi:hypothetical protein
MQVLRQNLPSAASAVAVSSTAIFNLPVKGPTYRRLDFHYQESGSDPNEATMKASISRVRVKVDGTVRRDLTLTRHLDLLKYYGHTVIAGYIPILFSLPFLRTPLAEENAAWGTANLQTLTVEFDIDSGAVSPTLSGEAEILPIRRPLGFIIEQREIAGLPIVSGDTEVSNLPKSYGKLMAMHGYSSSLTNLKTKINGTEFDNGSKATRDTVLKQNGNRVPQTNYVHVDPCQTNRLDDAWPLEAQDVRVTMTGSGSATASLTLETINNPFAVGQL